MDLLNHLFGDLRSKFSKFIPCRRNIELGGVKQLFKFPFQVLEVWLQRQHGLTSFFLCSYATFLPFSASLGTEEFSGVVLMDLMVEESHLQTIGLCSPQVICWRFSGQIADSIVEETSRIQVDFKYIDMIDRYIYIRCIYIYKLYIYVY